MNEKELKDIFFNRTEVGKSEQIVCDNCFEQVVFMLRDSQGNDFSVGLTTVLECLAFAVSEGNLPKLPISWLSNVDHTCGTGFSENEELYYSDHKTLKD